MTFICTLPMLPQVEPIFERFTQSHVPLTGLPIKPCHRLGIILKQLDNEPLSMT